MTATPPYLAASLSMCPPCVGVFATIDRMRSASPSGAEFLKDEDTPASLVFISASRVPETFAVSEQVRQVAMHDARGYRWGMRFWGAALASAGWLLFIMWRWESLDAPSQNKR